MGLGRPEQSQEEEVAGDERVQELLLLSVATNLEAGRRAELHEGEAGPW